MEKMEEEQDILVESFIEHLQENLNGMTETEILEALKMEIEFISEFQSYSKEYIERLKLVIEVYSDTGQKDILNLIF